MTEKRKSSRFMFDKPFTSDWLFWIFTFLVFANLYNGYANVQSSGGYNLASSFSIVSGVIDGAFRILFSWIMIFPIYLIRKIIRKMRKPEQTSGD